MTASVSAVPSWNDQIGRDLTTAELVIRAHKDRRREALKRSIMEAEIQTTALAAMLASMARDGYDTKEAEVRFAQAFDTLVFLRTDLSALSFLDEGDDTSI